MRKALALATLALIASSFAGVAHADPGGDCQDPVDAFCVSQDDSGNSTSCDVFVNAGTPADDCYSAN